MKIASSSTESLEKTMLSATFKDHIVHPRNLGKLNKAHAVGEAVAPECGDRMTVSIQVAGRRITDVRFKTFGCWAAVGAGSLVTEMVKGMGLEEARNFSLKELSEVLDGLPEEKKQCVQLVKRALIKAIADYDWQR